MTFFCDFFLTGWFIWEEFLYLSSYRWIQGTLTLSIRAAMSHSGLTGLQNGFCLNLKDWNLMWQILNLNKQRRLKVCMNKLCCMYSKTFLHNLSIIVIRGIFHRDSHIKWEFILKEIDILNFVALSDTVIAQILLWHFFSLYMLYHHN